jgi:hypothetical protein
MDQTSAEATPGTIGVPNSKTRNYCTEEGCPVQQMVHCEWDIEILSEGETDPAMVQHRTYGST